ncbi:MAG: hypothetical protein P0Y53_22355 [Candidatus Pseudobacter hemicellulosilyticus]|uniref:Uncharacterized protein n=1 Tax=Candidatus Pseudobacter hemicellulosilyticus TaxID=3121375 RepID=A0AAJ6BGG2_9BACT|nr:MAG: hypothetical protein P0Y53_22355 [Pseudobacter sp.]
MQQLKSNVTPLFLFGCGLALFLLAAGCSRNETAIRESFQSNLNFLALTADPLQLGVKIDGEIRITDLMAPADDATQVQLHYFNKEKRISIYDVATEQVLFDSLFVIHTNTVSISLFQQSSGSPLVLVAPPAGMAPPAAGYSKASIVYTFPELPAEVKVVVLNNAATGADYEPTDSFLLKKGEFSPYFLGKNGLRKPRLLFYTPDADRRLLAEVDAGQFSGLITPFVVLAIRRQISYVNGVYALSTQQLY